MSARSGRASVPAFRRPIIRLVRQPTSQFSVTGCPRSGFVLVHIIYIRVALFWPGFPATRGRGVDYRTSLPIVDASNRSAVQ